MGDEGFSHEGWEEPVEDLYIMEGADFDWGKYIHDISLPLPSQRGTMNNIERVLAFIFEHPGCDGPIIYASLGHSTGLELKRLSREGRIVWKGSRPGGGWFLSHQEWMKRMPLEANDR